MKREVQGALLAFLGAGLARVSLSDMYLRYVKAGMRPFLIATAVLLIVLGAWLIIQALRGKDEAEHAHEGMRAAWLLTLPVFTMILIAPPALGAYSAAREQSTVAAPASGFTFPPLPPGDPVALTLETFSGRAIWGPPADLEGRRVQLTGFVTPVPAGQMPNDLPQGAEASWWLTRLKLTCCAADAVAYKILAVEAAPLPADTWVEVTGTWIPGGGRDSATAIPWLKVESVREVPEPTNPYE